MKIDDFDLEKRIMIVAEIGNNHEGDFALAQDLIGLAAEAGAHAVKFQTYRTEQYISRREERRFARLKSYELSPEQFAQLSDVASATGLLFFSTPLDLPSVAVLAPLVSALKIASGDNTFFPLLEAAAQTGKPIILSAGLATIAELRASVAVIERTWAANAIKQKLAILHCVSSYPVRPHEANLAAIQQLRDVFRCTVGYSDHTLGIDAAALSVALGARIVEKHFTIDKHHSDFRDHQLSADPAEFGELVQRIQSFTTLIGHGRKTPQSGERVGLESMRRSIAARRELSAGTVIVADDLTWVRPAGGIAPGDERRLLGRKLKQHVAAGDCILASMVTDKE